MSSDNEGIVDIHVLLLIRTYNVLIISSVGMLDINIIVNSLLLAS
jgi:hypothetical protein